MISSKNIFLERLLQVVLIADRRLMTTVQRY